MGKVSVWKGAPWLQAPGFAVASPPHPVSPALAGGLLSPAARRSRQSRAVAFREEAGWGSMPLPATSHMPSTSGVEPRRVLGLGPEEGLQAPANTRLSGWRWKSVIQGSVTCLIRVSPACAFRHACLLGRAVTAPGQTSMWRGNVVSWLQEGAGSQTQRACSLKLLIPALVALAHGVAFPCLSLPVGGKTGQG